MGGGKDGKTLRCFLVQVRIVENHQNGKDTHVRGLKVFARDDRVRGGFGGMMGEGKRGKRGVEKVEKVEGGKGVERAWLVEPEWMGEAELR